VRNNKSYFHLVPKSYQNIQIANDLWPSTTGSSSLHKHFKLSTCNVQTLRSVSSWSAGTSRTESSIHAAMKHLIRTAKHYIYIENQFFISFTNNNNNNININANNSSNSCSGDTTNNNMNENQPVKNEIAQCLYNRIVKASQEKENFKVYIFFAQKCLYFWRLLYRDKIGGFGGTLQRPFLNLLGPSMVLQPFPHNFYICFDCCWICVRWPTFLEGNTGGVRPGEAVWWRKKPTSKISC